MKDTAITLTFDAFTASPSYCPLTYDCEQATTPTPPSGLLSIDQGTRTITISTSENADIGTYSINVIALTETGQSTGG